MIFRQIEASRRNARLSTGLVTEEGKKRSRQNALRHGLTAETVSTAASHGRGLGCERLAIDFRSVGKQATLIYVRSERATRTSLTPRFEIESEYGIAGSPVTL